MSVENLAVRLRLTGTGTFLSRREVENILGHAVPSDYYEFVARFPAGEFGNEVQVVHPDIYGDQAGTIRVLIEFFLRSGAGADFPSSSDRTSASWWSGGR
jgi:hypothetical protein